MKEKSLQPPQARQGGFIRAFALSSLVLLLVVATYLFLANRRSEPMTAADGTTHGMVAALPPAEFREMLENEGAFVVNTHIPYEGEITATDAFIPYDETTNRLSDYPVDRSTPILVYCESGRMSALAATELAAAGYEQVFDLAGGMRAWEAAGYERILR